MARVHLPGQEALLVLEPRTGGDAYAEGQGVFLVEQYKTREGGTWSVAGIESVLTDLRKAVPASRPRHARYRFVTDGRPGRVKALNAFLANIKLIQTPDDLNDTDERTFPHDVRMTDRQYFEHVVVATRNSDESEPDAGASQAAVAITEDEKAIVFHLLSNFEIVYNSFASDRATEVETLLRPYADHLGNERKIREHLVGLILETLSTGESRLDAAAIDALFKRAGLSPERLRRVAQLPDAMARSMERGLARFRYSFDQDVRTDPQWPSEKQILVIEGASGSGKTWQLARLLKRSAASRSLVTLISSGSSAGDVLTRVASDLWQLGLQETSERTLTAVSHFLRELMPNSPLPLLVIGVDDVQDIDVARALVRHDWQALRVRLVMTTPHHVATALQLTDGEAVHVHSVGDFSANELDVLLARNKRNWSELPPDLKRLLRNPILAGLYLGLPYTSIERAPRSEYEIFERFWERIVAKGRPGDGGIVLALAANILAGKPHPLARAEWRSIGLDSEEAASRLDAAGWLRLAGGGDVEFAHDRLLNWAVAKRLAHQLRLGEVTIADLAAFLTAEIAGAQQPLRSRLRYVPMDLLWMLSLDAKNTALLSEIIVKMESQAEYGAYGENLYGFLLPTLGDRAIPLLLQRLKQLSDNPEGRYRAALIGRGFIALAHQDGVDLEQTLADLLLTDSRAQQSVALAVLTILPRTRHLDRLWELHLQRAAELEGKSRDSRVADYDESFAALRIGTASSPEWLRNRIAVADPQRERVSELAYLLNSLDSPEATRMWAETRDILMQKVPQDRARSLLYAIARFKDQSQLDFVLRHVSGEANLTTGAALAALSVLEPRRALEHLATVNDAARDLFRGQWLPPLLRAEAELTRTRVLEIARAHPNARRIIESLFSKRADHMGVALLDYELAAIEKDLSEHLDAALSGDPMWLHGSLSFVGEVARPDLLAVLESRAGGALEEMIAAVAVSRGRNNERTLDRILESARRVLILMAGEGLTHLLRREVESEEFWVRHSGLLWAFMRPDKRIGERLSEIASQVLPQAAKDDAHLEHHMAMCALAHLGPDSVLVAALKASGVTHVPCDLARLRSHRGPLAKELTTSALTTLQDPQAAEEARLTALVIAWLSNEPLCVPLVRSVLANADAHGMVARFACITLQRLGDRAEDFVKLAERMLHTQANHEVALDALLSTGQLGLQPLARWVRGQSDTAPSEGAAKTIRALHAHASTRDLAIDAAIARGLHDIAAEANDSSLRERILDLAFSHVLNEETLLAIEGLAKFDPARAAQAIQLALPSASNLEREACQLLVRIAPESAGETLIDQAVAIQRPSLTKVVGQMLRLVDASSVTARLIDRMRGTLRDRRVAAELAGWIPVTALTDALGQLAEHDGAGEVRQTAFAALDQHAKLANVESLLALFPSASDARRWSLLTAVLEAGDPYLLSTSGDPLSLAKVLADVPFVFTHHAQSVLHNRQLRQ